MTSVSLHEEVVAQAATKGSSSTHSQPDKQDEELSAQSDLERDGHARQDAAPVVAAQVVGAEEVGAGGAFLEGLIVLLLVRIVPAQATDVLRGDGRDREQDQHCQRRHRQPVARQAIERVGPETPLSGR